MIVGKFALDAAVGVRATLDAPSATGIVNGGAYLDDVSGLSYVCVSTDAVDASDGVIGGFRYTTAGALRVYDASAGVPADASVNQGIAMTSDGQVCFTTEAGTARLNGVPLTAAGAVSMGVMTFLAEFADLGGGEVDTAVTFGGVSATFTRATTATTVDSAGLIVSVASGTPRSYYDPTTLEYLGYLAEGARTNLCLQSEVFDNASWSKTDTTITADAVVSPDGTVTGDLLTQGATGTSDVRQTVTATADVNYAFSVWAKRGNNDWLWLATFNGGNSVRAWFNLSTGAVGTLSQAGTALGVSHSIETYPNGWYRCTVVGSVGSGATAISALVRATTNDNTITTQANATYYAWGAQFENNVSFASSYIPTTTASVTRNADVLTYPTTGWLNASAGTMYAELLPFNVTTTQVPVSLNDGSTNNEIYFRVISGPSTRLVVTDATVNQVNLATGTPAANTSYSQASAYEANNFASCQDGGTVATDTSGTIPAGLSTLNIGSTTSAGSPFYGPIRRVGFFPQRLPNSTLQALTA